MRWPDRLTKRDALRAGSAAKQAVAASAAAQTLFEVGGRRVLPASLQRLVKAGAEKEASRVLAVRLLASGRGVAGLLEGAAGRVLAAQTVGVAARQIVKSLGAAAGAGAVLDGGWALARAVRRMGAGTMTAREAAVHVAREAGTGAAATAAGTGAAVLLVALTGGVAAPALFAVAASASLAAKLGLDAWLKPDADTEQAVLVRALQQGSAPLEMGVTIGAAADEAMAEAETT